MGNQQSNVEAGATAAAGAVVSKLTGGGKDKDKDKDDDTSSSSSSQSDKKKKKPHKHHHGKRRTKKKADTAVSSSRLRRRRENYREELANEKARAKVRADKAGCCGDGNGSSDSEDEVPYDPGSEYSDDNFYVNRYGERHRRQPRPEGQTSSEDADDDSGVDPTEVPRSNEPLETDDAHSRSVEPQSTLIPVVAPSPSTGGGTDRLRVALEAMEYRQRLLILDSADDEFALMANFAACNRDGAKRNELMASASDLLFTTPLPARNQAAIINHMHRLVHPPHEGDGSPLNSPNGRSSFPKQPLERGGLVFDLGGMQLGDDSAYLAARALRSRESASHLTHLLLPSSAVTDHGVDVLCAAMDAMDPPFWQFVDLSGNAITMKGATRIVAALEAMYPSGRPSKFRREVSLDANDHVWMVATAHRQSLSQRCLQLQACNIFVTLPPKPVDD